MEWMSHSMSHTLIEFDVQSTFVKFNHLIKRFNVNEYIPLFVYGCAALTHMWRHMATYIVIDQHWFRWWLAAWWQHSITETKVEFSLTQVLWYSPESSFAASVPSSLQWRLKSPASALFTRPFIQAQIKESIKAPRQWPLCGEFTGDRRIPDKELVTRKMSPFDDVIMYHSDRSLWNSYFCNYCQWVPCLTSYFA